MNGEHLTDENVQLVEFSFGKKIVKIYPEEVAFEEDAFVLHLTQEETFSLSSGSVSYQIRVLFPDGSVKASPVISGMVAGSISKAVLS
jgi:hypothetical protein